MTRPVRVALLACVACLVLSSSNRLTVRGQEPTFRGGVDLVQLDVIVLDRNRRPVEGLTAADFTILEDGKPRNVDAFAAITLPPPVPVTGAAWTREVAPDVVTNEREEDGRLVVIVMDRTIQAGEPTIVARTIAHSVVDSLGSTDVAAVVRTSGFRGEGVQQNFTADRSVLRAAIESPFMGLTSDGGGGECICGLCVLHEVARIADVLAMESRRHKMLLFIGSGIGIEGRPWFSETMGMDCKSMLLMEREVTLRAIDRGNVTFHTLDPNALQTVGPNAETRFIPAPSETFARRENNMLRQSDLTALPEYTGGRAVLNTNAPESQVSAIFAESQSYYLLGFQRILSERPNTRRNIRVRVNRDNVIVRSRAGYYTPAQVESSVAAVEPATGALTGLLPKTDIPLTLALTPRFRPDGAPSVNVIVGIADGSRDSDRVFDVTIGVFDHRARPVGTERQTVEAPASLAVGDVVETQSFLTLEPGHYEVRIGVADATSGAARAGSVYGYVEVPDVRSRPVTLSGVLMTAREPSAIDLPMPVMAAPLAPTLRRTFAKTDSVTAFTQVHQRASPRLPISLRTRIVDTGDHVVTESTRTIDSAGFSDGGVADVSFSVPIATLDPGHYLLSIEVTMNERTDRRDVRFEVR